MRQLNVKAIVAGVVAAAALPSCATLGVAPGCEAGTFRVAVVDAGLVGRDDGEIVSRLSTDFDPQAQAVARVLQRSRPDIALLVGFDWDSDARGVRRFVDRYLRVPPDGQQLEYPHRFAAPVNRGEPSGLDLDDDGRVGGPGDAWSWGRYRGQGGMVLLSRYPIAEPVRTFRDLPLESRDESAGPGAVVRRLATTSIWDVPVTVPGATVRIVAADTMPLPEAPATAASTEMVRAQAVFLLEYARGSGRPGLSDDQGRQIGLGDGPGMVLLGRMAGLSPAAASPSSGTAGRGEGAAPAARTEAEAAHSLGLRASGALVVCREGEEVGPVRATKDGSSTADATATPVRIVWKDLAFGD